MEPPTPHHSDSHPCTGPHLGGHEGTRGARVVGTLPVLAAPFIGTESGNRFSELAVGYQNLPWVLRALPGFSELWWGSQKFGCFKKCGRGGIFNAFSEPSRDSKNLGGVLRTLPGFSEPCRGPQKLFPLRVPKKGFAWHTYISHRINYSSKSTPSLTSQQHHIE